MNRKKILIVTGTRADFGKLRPVGDFLSDLHDVYYFVTGMHLKKEYGLTVKEVRKAKFKDYCEFINYRDCDDQDIILAKTIIGLSDYINENRPDMIIIHGDRVEALAASTVASFNNILSLHIEGGELSGTIDEVIRHCNTKLCSVHFVSSDHAKSRLINMGENPARIFNVGSPELDIHKANSGVSIDLVKKHYEIDYNDFGIVIFHPVTTEYEFFQDIAKEFFKQLIKTNYNYIVILPNNDPGSEFIRFEISKLSNNKNFKVIPSMRFNYFSELLKNCSLLVGNSSAGVREAPFIGVHSIDVGTRQHNRSYSDSISTIDYNNLKDLNHIITSNWGKTYNSSYSYGTGNTLFEIEKIFETKDIWEIPSQKKFYE